MKALKVITQLWKYAKARKKYWILPFAIALVTISIILVASQGTVIAPLIYTLF